eukprot:9305644-Pyramimonas_sp.AAC.1
MIFRVSLRSMTHVTIYLCTACAALTVCYTRPLRKHIAMKLQSVRRDIGRATVKRDIGRETVQRDAVKPFSVAQAAEPLSATQNVNPLSVTRYNGRDTGRETVTRCR